MVVMTNASDSKLRNDNQPEKPGFRVTGRMVFVTVTLFFVVVVGVNVVMAYLALTTFGGVKTEAAYKMGLKYNEEIAAAQAQSNRGWRISSNISLKDGERRLIVVNAQDRDGAPLKGMSAQAKLVSPTHPSNVQISFSSSENGIFRSEFSAPKGQWDLELELFDGAERKYRTSNRVMLR
jgi:nitrogen fixation protein FixH